MERKRDKQEVFKYTKKPYYLYFWRMSDAVNEVQKYSSD